MIVRAGNLPKVDQKFEAMLVWMDETSLVPGKEYLFKQTGKVTPGRVTPSSIESISTHCTANLHRR